MLFLANNLFSILYTGISGFCKGGKSLHSRPSHNFPPSWCIASKRRIANPAQRDQFQNYKDGFRLANSQNADSSLKNLVEIADSQFHHKFLRDKFVMYLHNRFNTQDLSNLYQTNFL